MSSVTPLHGPRAVAIPSIASQQAIENALSMALYYVRNPGTQQGIHAATAKAVRATALLKQACADEQSTVREV